MERQVGEIFTYKDKTYQVIKISHNDKCAECAFNNTIICDHSILGECINVLRKDNNDIAFKEINNMEIKDNILTIEIPEGMEVDIENTDLTKGIVKFKQKRNITYNDIELALNLPGDNTCMVAHKYNILKLTAISVLMNIAKYYNGDWKPNWNNINESKYYIYYNHKTGKYGVSSSTCTKYNNVYFRLLKDAQAVIDNSEFEDILDTIYKK